MIPETSDQYEQRIAKREAENKARQTDPPTLTLANMLGNSREVEYPDHTYVEFVCCGPLRVFYEAGAYRTFVRCTSCQKQVDVHTG